MNIDPYKISSFDASFSYNGYVLVNELYEDDEGFFKNQWQWGKEDGEWVINLQPLKGLSSNSYAKFKEAKEVFLKLIEKK